jgi:hypothetical protein
MQNDYLDNIFYGCKTWSLILRQGHGLKVFENRLLKRIFVLKRTELMGGCRRVHKNGLRNSLLLAKY